MDVTHLKQVLSKHMLLLVQRQRKKLRILECFRRFIDFITEKWHETGAGIFLGKLVIVTVTW